MAGRHLPIRRTAIAVAALVALAAGPAFAAGEWQVQSNAPAAPTGDNVWSVTPSGGTWAVSNAPASNAPPTPESILDALVSASNGAAPPAPPTAVTPDPVQTVELDPDTPEVKALLAAETKLESVSAALAEVRGQLDEAPPQDLGALRARESKLVAAKAAAAADVDELRAAVAKLQAKAEAKAAREAAALPFFVAGGLPFSPVTSTIPTIDANLANRLDAYLGAKGSPLAGHASAFVYQSTAVGLDPRLLVAIAGAETSFATYGPSQQIHNPFGMGPGIVYPSWDDSIAAAARNLGGSLYKGSGLITIAQIQRRWAPLGASNDPTQLNSNWYRNVSRYYAELGGDPNGSVFLNTAASRIAIPVAPGVAPGIQGTVAAPTAYGPAVAIPGGGRGTGPAALALAQTFIGVPYRWGGENPRTGFDCSGLVQYVYAKQGVRLPRVAEQQARVGTPIPPEQLAPGDAVFFADRSGYIHHEGMYIGQGMFIHAPHTGDVVKISSLYEPYYATQYAGARRY